LAIEKLLSWLEGREAETNQRLSVDVCAGDDVKGGFEVWGGGKDGMVRVWEGVGGVEGAQEVEWEWRVGDGKYFFFLFQLYFLCQISVEGVTVSEETF